MNPPPTQRPGRLLAARAILDSVPSQIAVLDRAGTIVAVNEPWMGTAREQAAAQGMAAPEPPVGVSYLEVCRRSAQHPEDDASRALRGILDVLEGRSDRFDLEYAFHSPGKRRWFGMTVTPLRAPSRGAVVAHTEITERKQAEAELELLRSQMEDMMRAYVASQTVLAIAHELHQPLHAIATYSEAALRLLRDGNAAPERLARAVQGSAEQAQRASRVVHELVDLLSRGAPEQEAMDLNEAVRHAIFLMQGSHATLSAVLHLEPGLAPVRANRLQVKKVLINLIQNGVEAMHAAGIAAGAITITARTAADGRMAHVTLCDSGPGMDEAIVRRVFDPFFTTKPTGLGMGLTISRSMIDANGGRLWLETQPLEGACFHFTLPFAR